MEVETTDHASGRHPQMQFFQPRAESDVVSVGTEKEWLQEDLLHPHREVEDGTVLPSSRHVDDPKQKPCRFLDDLVVLSKHLQRVLDHAAAVCEEVDNSLGVEDNHEAGEVEDPKLDHHMAYTEHQGAHKA